MENIQQVVVDWQTGTCDQCVSLPVKKEKCTTTTKTFEDAGRVRLHGAGSPNESVEKRWLTSKRQQGRMDGGMGECREENVNML